MLLLHREWGLLLIGPEGRGLLGPFGTHQGSHYGRQLQVGRLCPPLRLQLTLSVIPGLIGFDRLGAKNFIGKPPPRRRHQVQPVGLLIHHREVPSPQGR